MYDELAKRIRRCATDPMHCLSCGEVKDGRCFKRLMTQAADSIEKLSKQLDDMNEANIALYGALQKWIPVTERLPTSQGPFFTRYGFGAASRETGQYFFGARYYLFADLEPHWQDESLGVEVTHWMPIPPLPEEDDDA